ncbi:MAG: hypothetical protein P4L87_25510 [Formivibrio sp.]|nr:hypothetical protein [Formivibrio sp.]
MHTNALVKVASALSCLLLSSSLLAQQEKPLPAPAAKAVARDMTLREFRKIYLNQRILILKGTDAGGGSLGGWQPVRLGKDGSYKDDYSKGAFIDFRYKDQTPRILAIRENTLGGLETPQEGQKNAMGEIVTDDDIVNPSVEVFMQFEDGQLARYSSIVSLIRDRSVKNADQDPDYWDMEFMLVSARDDHAAVITPNLSSTIGQKVYAIYDSLLFGPDITPVDMLDLGRRETKRVRDVPLLTQMTVVAAKYNDRYDFIVWKLRLDDGREVITASRYRDEDVSKIGNDNSFLGRSISTLLLKVPSNLTAQEIAAIRTKKIFRGMSRQAVIYSWGTASENDYGKGGKQMVYGDNQFVYLDNNGKVTDWQNIDR